MVDDTASVDLMRECHNLPEWARNDFWLLVIKADRGEIVGIQLVDAFTELFQRTRSYSP